MGRKVYLAALALLVAAVVLAGCGREREKEAVEKQVLRYVLESEPATLDPAKSTAIPESLVELQLFEGLTRLDSQDQPRPGVAEGWEISADGMTYRFFLRKNARWSNGDAVTAGDFVFAWRRVLDPEAASENAYMLYPVKNAQAYNEKQAQPEEVGVQALDDHTLEVTLEKPTAYFLGLTAFHAFYPVHPPTVKAQPLTWAIEQRTLVGNGPFAVSRWVHNGIISFVRNEAYWDAGTVKLKGMEWPISDSQGTRLALVENRQADMMVEPPVMEQERLKTSGLLKIAPYLGNYYYVFNTQKAPFDDVRVRRAFALAVNRQGLVDNVIRGGKEPAYAWVPPGLTNPDSGQDFRQEGGNYLQEDAQQARQLLSAAGYPQGQGLPEITLLFNTNEMHKAVAEAMQEMWQRNLGITVRLINQESKVFLASRTEGDFQIARASWIGDYADPMTFMDVFQDTANDARYSNVEYNRLIAAAQGSSKQQLRMAAMHQAEQILCHDAVIIPIYYTTQPYVAQPYVKGYFWSVLGLADFKGAYLEQGAGGQ